MVMIDLSMDRCCLLELIRLARKIAKAKDQGANWGSIVLESEYRVIQGNPTRVTTESNSVVVKSKRIVLYYKNLS